MVEITDGSPLNSEPRSPMHTKLTSGFERKRVNAAARTGDLLSRKIAISSSDGTGAPASTLMSISTSTLSSAERLGGTPTETRSLKLGGALGSVWMYVCSQTASPFVIGRSDHEPLAFLRRKKTPYPVDGRPVAAGARGMLCKNALVQATGIEVPCVTAPFSTRSATIVAFTVPLTVKAWTGPTTITSAAVLRSETELRAIGPAIALDISGTSRINTNSKDVISERIYAPLEFYGLWLGCHYVRVPCRVSILLQRVGLDPRAGTRHSASYKPNLWYMFYQCMRTYARVVNCGTHGEPAHRAESPGFVSGL